MSATGQTDSISLNVQTRQLANTLVELGVTLAHDEGLHEHPDAVRKMWKHVIEIASNLIGEKPASIVETKVRDFPVADLMVPSDDYEMTFGKHQGERLGDIPDGYFRWLSEQDWLEDKYPELLAYIQENELD